MGGPPNPPPAELAEAVKSIRAYADETISSGRVRDSWELLRHLFSDSFITRLKITKPREWVSPANRTYRDRRIATPRYGRPFQQDELPDKLVLSPEQKERYRLNLKTLADQKEQIKVAEKRKAEALAETEKLVRLHTINLERQKLDQEIAQLKGITYTFTVPRTIQYNLVKTE